jgi:hypothetical protein
MLVKVLGNTRLVFARLLAIRQLAFGMFCDGRRRLFSIVVSLRVNYGLFAKSQVFTA